MTREQIIEAMARAGLMSEASAGVVLRALEAAIPGLADVIAGTAVVVPKNTDGKRIDAMASNIRGAGFSGDSYLLARVCYRAMIEAGKAVEP